MRMIILHFLSEKQAERVGHQRRFDQCRPFRPAPVTSTLHTALNELVDAGIVEKDTSLIRLADPIFVRYIRRSYSTIYR